MPAGAVPMVGKLPAAAAGSSYFVEFQVNTGDLMRLNARIRGIPVRITTELRNRATAMAAKAVSDLDAAAPVGQSGDWARGSPPIRGSHRSSVVNAFYAIVWSDAPHTPFIVNGFEPHMPPERAWLGDPELSYVMRRAVLHNETPENPRDYWAPVQVAMAKENADTAARMAARVIPPA